MPPHPPESDLHPQPDPTLIEILEEIRAMSVEIAQLKHVIIPGKRGVTFPPTSAETQSEWMTVAEFARKVGLSTQTIQRRIRDNEFSSKAVRNIGSEDRPLYRMNTRYALEEFYKL